MPQVGIMLEPPGKTEITATISWSDIGCDHRRLYCKGARTAHRINQSMGLRFFESPASLRKDRCSEMFLQGCTAMFTTISPSVQTFARQVQAQARLIFVYVNVDMNIGLLLLYRRSAIKALTKLIDNRILDL